MKLTVAIIDDELHAIETLVYDLNEGFGDTVMILFTTTNPVEGLKQIKSKKPDLVFLDIQMPGLSGIDVLSLVDDLDIMVVITTAHQKFAIEVVGTKAIAYLLKPIQPEKLESVMNTIFSKKKNNPGNKLLKDKISVADLNGVELIPHNEIVYFKSDGNYSTLFLTSKRTVVVSKTLKHFSEKLPEKQFLRVHKSYVINLSHVKRYVKTDGGELIMSNNDVLPVSRNFRSELLKIIQNYS